MGEKDKNTRGGATNCAINARDNLSKNMGKKREKGGGGEVEIGAMNN